ncbi:MAG: hypothetical protein NC548_60475 [Lachnospiraceae bacterium]|nr:hypothetical protein [Lachnospiraceae bacterium]
MDLIRVTQEFINETDLFNLLGITFVETDPNPRATDEKPINHVGDCTVCAVSNLLSVPYDDAYRLLATQGAEDRKMMNDMRVVSEVCAGYGYKSYRISTSPRVTFASFMHLYKRGRFLLADRDHIIAYVDGVIYDRPRMRGYDVEMMGKRLFCVITNVDIGDIVYKVITSVDD